MRFFCYLCLNFLGIISIARFSKITTFNHRPNFLFRNADTSRFSQHSNCHHEVQHQSRSESDIRAEKFRFLRGSKSAASHASQACYHSDKVTTLLRNLNDEEGLIMLCYPLKL